MIDLYVNKYLRNDRLHINKNNPQSNWYKLLEGLSAEFIIFDKNLQDYKKDYNLNNTTLLIEEWEKMAGIPDDCIGIAKTIEERRKNVLFKLASYECTTKSQFELIANILGYNVNVMAGGDVMTFPLKFPIVFGKQEEMPFIIIVNISKEYKNQGFPYTFPITFGASISDVLACFFERLKPAQTKIIYRYV
jgi:uncharacterized protein YmfQ (DUF2313 family)